MHEIMILLMKMGFPHLMTDFALRGKFWQEIFTICQSLIDQQTIRLEMKPFLNFSALVLHFFFLFILLNGKSNASPSTKKELSKAPLEGKMDTSVSVSRSIKKVRGKSFTVLCSMANRMAIIMWIAM